MLDIVSAAAIGIGFGIFLQKGRFCFVSAFRDFFAYKDSRVLRGVVAGILTMTVGVGIAYFSGTPTDRFWVPNFGLSSLIGGFVFGVGMTVGGGCASGTLYRAAQGYLHYWVMLAFTLIGYVVFAALFTPVFLPYYFTPLQVFGGVSAFFLVPRTLAPILTTTVVFAAVLAYRGFYRNRGTDSSTSALRVRPPSIPLRPLSLRLFSVSPIAPRRQNAASFLRREWNTTWCGIGIGILASAWFVLWNTWSITGPEVRWTGLLLAKIVGVDYLNGNAYWSGVVFSAHGMTISLDMIMLVGLMVGAMIAAFWSGDFRVRKPLWRRTPNMIAGGLLMGFGARMAPGCNISNAFAGLGILSLSSAVATLGLVLGVYATTHWMFRKVGCAL